MTDAIPTVPLTIQALGEIAADGSPRPSAARVVRQGPTFVVDGWACFVAGPFLERVPNVESHCWARVPGFLLTADPERVKKLLFLFQINSLPFPGPYPLLHALFNVQRQVCLMTNEAPRMLGPCIDDTAKLLEAETLLESGKHRKAGKILDALHRENLCDPRYWFDRGIQLRLSGAPGESLFAFQRAAELGHLDAHDAVRSVSLVASQPFRARYPQIFRLIESGEPHRALPLLFAAREKEPLYANVALAYCLRNAGRPMEGIAACEEVLEQHPVQPDVFSHYWSYLTALQRDDEALAIAQRRLALYPFDAAAYNEALDSALLLGKMELAFWYAHGALVVSRDPEAGLRSLFKLHEATRTWQELQPYYDTVLPLLPSPSVKVLTEQGETLIELSRFKEAFAMLERALRIAPDHAPTVLAYGRGLARSGKEREAVRFMSTVIGDTNRCDSLSDRYLIVSLMSELLRNTESIDEALALWPRQEEFTPELLAAVGPRPFVEYAACLLGIGQEQDAAKLYSQLDAEFHDLPIVERLRTVLVELGAFGSDGGFR
jgi:tetratricopeptide (TPR) repeat protein